MKRLSASGAALFLLFATAVACLHASGRSSEQVLAAHRERIAAMLAADPQRLAAALHESLSYTHSNGRVDSKTSLIDSLISGQVDYRAIAIDEPSVRIRGSTAEITGGARMEVTTGGKHQSLANVYTAVYWWEAGRWQLIAYESSPAVTP